MAILKTRPKVRIRVPNEVRPGTTITVTVLLDCKREVHVDYVQAHLFGREGWSSGAGKHRVTNKLQLISLGARVSGERTLPVGRTELPIQIPLPKKIPPSYRGNAGSVEYELQVHVSVPWWPDRRARFEIHVAPEEQPNPVSRPFVYSPRPEGPESNEPHVEVSLATTWTRAGDMVSGAFALSNVEHNRYSEVKVGLLATEQLYDGGRLYAKREHMRYLIRIGAERAVEGEMIPFRFRIPEEVPVGLEWEQRPGGRPALVSIRWSLELVVGIRWGRDLELKVPYTVLPASARPGDAPARIAPPVVGSDRLSGLWTHVGQRTGLRYEGQALSARYGETLLSVRREHLGRRGLHLLAEIEYPELHLALEVQPAKGLQRMGLGGVKIGDPAWDKEHYVIARDEGQVAAMLRSLLPSLELGSLRRMDDRTLTVEARGAGLTRHALEPFVVSAALLARTLEGLRTRIPPPPAMALALPAWERLATRLGASLETARMRVTGKQGLLGAEVRLAFDDAGQPLSTWLSVESPARIDDNQQIHWRAVDGMEALLRGHSGEAAELLGALGGTVCELTVEPERVAAEVDALLGLPGERALGVEDAERLLGRMARLVAVLGGKKGPYR